MKYDHKKQYRCTIIRGKAKTDLDNLLPTYAGIIEEICPTSKDTFIAFFDNELSKVLPSASSKTIKNHRTEIAGKLFGLYYINENKEVISTEKNKMLLSMDDNPRFFKEICIKFQFPNGMDKIQTTKEKINKNISVKPLVLVTHILNEAEKKGLLLSVDEIAYFVLNSLDALSGNFSAQEIVNSIIDCRKSGVVPKVEHPGKQSSYSMQHIREQLNLLELANLVRVDNERNLSLNKGEKEALNVFLNASYKPEFDVLQYDLSKQESSNQMILDWAIFYGKLSEKLEQITETPLSAIQVVEREDVELEKSPFAGTENMVALGDDGERFILSIEKERVSNYSQRLTNKVVWLGKVKGLGYDIQSIRADGSDFSEFVKYIEVKSTKRVTEPNINSETWSDTLNITRNEWIAAQQHNSAYYIYRVYFTPNKIHVCEIENPFEKSSNNEETGVRVTAINYRLDFDKRSIDKMKAYAR